MQNYIDISKSQRDLIPELTPANSCISKSLFACTKPFILETSFQVNLNINILYLFHKFSKYLLYSF